MKTVWRCDVTGNPVGTDTVMIGAPACDCQGCRASAEIERLREKLEQIKTEARMDTTGLWVTFAALVVGWAIANMLPECIATFSCG